jgi:carboxypeptidase PM20D1
MGLHLQIRSRSRSTEQRLDSQSRSDSRPCQSHQEYQQTRRLLSLSIAFLKRAIHEFMRETVNGFSLIYRWQGSDSNERPILLIAHLDVVPPNGEWSRPPFAGLVEDDFIWGRGSLDDKVSALGILEAVEFLLEAGFEPRRTIYLAFGHDEEISGKNGAQATARLFPERGIRFSFVLDEGSPIGVGLVPGVDRPVALIGTAEKSYLSVELNVTESHWRRSRGIG